MTHPQVLMCPTKHFRELITAVNQRLSLKRRQIMHIREMGGETVGRDLKVLLKREH
jgi:hypothetical protein